MQELDAIETASPKAWSTPLLVRLGTVADVAGLNGGTSQGKNNS